MVYIYHDRILETYSVYTALTTLCDMEDLNYHTVYDHIGRKGREVWKGKDGEIVTKAKFIKTRHN